MMTKSTFYSITPGKLARIFLRIYVKINLNTVNNTSTKLSIDIFSVEFKTKLLRITVLELETLMLRMISSKIPFEDLLKRRHELFSNLILNVLEKIEPTQFEKMKAAHGKSKEEMQAQIDAKKSKQKSLKEVIADIPKQKANITKAYLWFWRYFKKNY